MYSKLKMKNIDILVSLTTVCLSIFIINIERLSLAIEG